VETVNGGDYLPLAAEFLVADFPRKFQRCLVGFSAAVAEKALVTAAQIAEPFSQFRLQWVMEQVAGVPQH
jgi:hypothetical protein